MTIITEFQKITLMYPNKIALRSDMEGILTYKELNERSNFIAKKICTLKQDSKYIGVFLNRSFDMIATLLGIMKAGCGYVPIDPTYPQERVNLMLYKSQVNVIVCNDENSKRLDDNYVKLIVGDDIGFSKENVDFSRENDIACVIFSSGSTGQPNGVMMSHRSLLNTLQWVIKYYHLGQYDVDLQVPSISYTSSVEDIFSTLLSGGTLIILDEKKLLNIRYLYNSIEKHQATHFIMVPSLYKELIRVMSMGYSLKFVILAGEPLTRQLIKTHFKKIPYVSLIMEYGMAETCATCFVNEIHNENCYLTIGNPIVNTGFAINAPDSDGIGELYVCGEGLFSGYCNDEKITSEKIKLENGIKYLKTGDYVQCKNNELVFWGRKDKQIKVNGKRVNLSEVDHILQSFNEIEESLTLPIKDQDTQVIVSFIKTDITDVEKYRQSILEKLPLEFVPDKIIKMDSFLYLPNKKIDITEMKKVATNIWRKDDGNN